MKLYLVRHTSVAVENGLCYGRSDVAVAPTFLQEASRVKAELEGKNFDAVFCSPLSRCRQLAEFCGFPHPEVEARLRELDFGSWEMQKWEDIQDPALARWFEDWIHLPAGGAESYEQQYQRVADFLRELQRSSYEEVCAFTHRGSIACALVYAGICPIEKSFGTEIPYGSVTCLTL